MIQLVRMTSAEFDAFVDMLVEDYAKEKVAAGNWSVDEALERSRRETMQLLPQGLETVDQHLFSIVAADEPEPIGILWYAVKGEGNGRYAWVYDVVVKEPFRRRGYASEAFRAMEVQVAELGIHSIQLHVFGFNHGAQAMYAQLGYNVTNVQMRKDLGNRQEISKI